MAAKVFTNKALAVYELGSVASETEEPGGWPRDLSSLSSIIRGVSRGEESIPRAP